MKNKSRTIYDSKEAQNLYGGNNPYYDREMYEEDQISNPADAEEDYEEGYRLMM
jgi:hypothetical protein